MEPAVNYYSDEFIKIYYSINFELKKKIILLRSENLRLLICLKLLT